MIAFRDDLPLIQLEDGVAVNFERQWLISALRQAAGKAGYDQWWLAEHVAESVTQYLRGQREWTVITVERLGQAVQAAVEVIGYADIASFFVPGRPCARVSLLDLARTEGNCYELAFFQSLGALIDKLVSEAGGEFTLLELEDCVKLLAGRKIWSRECDALQAEIVEFTRRRAASAAGSSPIGFALA